MHTHTHTSSTSTYFLEKNKNVTGRAFLHIFSILVVQSEAEKSHVQEKSVKRCGGVVGWMDADIASDQWGPSELSEHRP